MQRLSKSAIAITVGLGLGAIGCGDNSGDDEPTPDAGAPGHMAYAVSGDFASTGVFTAIDVASKAVRTNALAGVAGGDPVLRQLADEVMIVNRDSGENVTVLGGAPLALIDQYGTGGGSNPQDVAAVGGKLYVPALGTAGVVVIDRATRATHTVAIAGDPDGVPDCVSAYAVGAQVFVACGLLDENFAPRGDGLVAVIDSTTDTVTATVRLPAPNPVGLFARTPSGALVIGTAPSFTDFTTGCLAEVAVDGAHATRCRLDEAARALAAGGRFGYRFHWPPMRVGAREVVWHRALAFVVDAPAAAPRQLDVGAGVLVASRPGAAPIHLWPRADARPPWTALERGFAGHAEARHDVRKLLDARARLGEPLPPSLATRLVSADRDARWAAWRAALPGHAADPAAARTVTAAIDRAVARREPPPDRPRTFARTATRAFEERYWRTIAGLAHATWRAKNNADGVAPARPGRDLDGLADELARRHQAAIARAGMGHRAVVGHHWFRWTTEFDMPWSHGWVANQLHGPRERNVICVIPGRDRTRAVVLADHYDTAYMEDVYDGKLRTVRAGTRHAAAGADDNHSATAALLLAADVLLPMSAAGQLAHDVWLVHLTGEEFPGDSLGARALARALVAGDLTLHAAGSDRPIALGGVAIAGAIVMDMIAHRDPRAGYRFQIAPGESAGAMRVAAALHRATEAWNRGAARWNRAQARAAARPYRRRANGTRVPTIAPHPTLVGELRPHWHWSSTVFNTDAQCWSDLGLPIALVMEHYDIDRQGYHDTHDTLANIDLDFGAAIAAIAIEAATALAIDGG